MAIEELGLQVDAGLLGEDVADPIVEEIARERSDIKVGKINIEDEQALAREFRVMSIPTLLVVKNGQVVNRSVRITLPDCSQVLRVLCERPIKPPI